LKWACRGLLAVVVVLGGGRCGPPTLETPAPQPEPVLPPLPSVALTTQGKAAIALAEATPELPASLVVRDDTAWSPISGNSIAEIAAALHLSRGISDSDFVGATVAYVHWEFAQQRLGDSCRITSVHVTLNVETRLPRWQPDKPGSPTLHRQWDQFLAATERHENGHRNIALSTAASIARSLAIEHGLACADMAKLADATARTRWDLGNDAQLTYDAATRHGVMQGSQWPPFAGDSS